MPVFLEEGTIFSGCKILSRCGNGAFGITYLAQTPLDEKIIIKMVASPLGAERELKGLRSYMQIAGSHPNLLKIFHSGLTDEGFFYTMEAADNCGTDGKYVPATLGNLLKKFHSFTPEEAIRIIRELLDAVRVMHETGLIHRDIKPENIIFVNGRPKLSDPGLVTEVGKEVSFAGTFGFIPPECFNGSKPMGCNADLYALGMVFYCMVTGFSPKDYPRLPLDMRIEVCRQVTPPLLMMCNRNPAKRFKSAQEFLDGLPEKLENPTPFEKFREDFKEWRLCNRRKMRTITFSATAGLILLSGAVTWCIHKEKYQRLQTEVWQRETTYVDSCISPRQQLLELQLEVYFPEIFKEYTRLRKLISQDRASGRWETAAKNSRLLLQLLQRTAENHLGTFSYSKEKMPEGKTGFTFAGNFHGFMTTPLAVFAPQDAIKTARNNTSRLEEKLYFQWPGPRCGQEFSSVQDYDKKLVFMAPGALRMRHNNKLVRIPYHYWIGKYEVTGESFRGFLGENPRLSSVSNTPLERICWNDVLYYCHTVWLYMKNWGLVPPGYILRPPTEAEWEFAAQNGWLGEDELPLTQRAFIKTNSGNTTHPVGSLQPAKSGIYDIYGNVSELVVPEDKPAMHLSVIARGGDFRSTPEKCYERLPYLAFQYIPDSIGFRFVLAPGDESFYDRHFFMGGTQQIRHKGKVIELVMSQMSVFDHHMAEKFAKLLGGRLAEFEDREQMEHICRSFPVSKLWPVIVGLRKVNGKWQWSDGREMNYGKWRRFREHGEPRYAAVWNNLWFPIERLRIGTFFCEWPEKTYPERNKHLDSGEKLPLELTRFTYKNREFIAINSKIGWFGALRVCELLGGRLAVLETEELRKIAIEKLKHISEKRLFLGGYAKRDNWFFLDGSEIKFPLVKDHLVKIPGCNKNFLTLYRGRFYNSHYSEAFLLERQRSSDSSKCL